MLNSDYKDILRALIRKRVRFMVVGAYAMSVQGYPRSTGDLDILIERSRENAQRLHAALVEFGAPLHKVDAGTFCKPGIVFQIGVVPRRIDLLTSIDGVAFHTAFQRRKNVRIDGLNVPFLSRKDLIRNKRATNRPKDKADLAYLEPS